MRHLLQDRVRRERAAAKELRVQHQNQQLA
jgi:hypothetical protein